MEENKKENKLTPKRNIKLIILIITFILLILIDFIILYNYFCKKYSEYIKNKPSDMHMIVAEVNNQDPYNPQPTEKKIIYYFIFDKHGHCSTCFAKLTNTDVIGGPEQVFFNPRKIGNDTYVELPDVRVYTIEDIQSMFADYIIKEW